MASRLDYQVPAAPLPGARAELDDLIQTLHASGTLRFLNGFFGRLGAVNDVALTELQSPPGSNALGTVLFLGEMLAKVPTDDLRRMADGLSAGLERSGRLMNEEPPSSLAVLRMLREPETRRCLAGLLVILKAVGGQMGKSSRAHERNNLA